MDALGLVARCVGVCVGAGWEWGGVEQEGQVEQLPTVQLLYGMLCEYILHLSQSTGCIPGKNPWEGSWPLVNSVSV